MSRETKKRKKEGRKERESLEGEGGRDVAEKIVRLTHNRCSLPTHTVPFSSILLPRYPSSFSPRLHFFIRASSLWNELNLRIEGKASKSRRREGGERVKLISKRIFHTPLSCSIYKLIKFPTSSRVDACLPLEK